MADRKPAQRVAAAATAAGLAELRRARPDDFDRARKISRKGRFGIVQAKSDLSIKALITLI